MDSCLRPANARERASAQLAGSAVGADCAIAAEDHTATDSANEEVVATMA
jgi:hypothetical protein